MKNIAEILLKSAMTLVAIFIRPNFVFWVKRQHKKLYGYWVSHFFKKAGTKWLISPFDDLRGAKYISIGSDIIFGEHCFLTAWDSYSTTDGFQTFSPSITIGNNCHFGAFNHISSSNHIEIGDGFLSGKWVSIVDNAHGKSGFDTFTSPNKREIYSKGPIIIGKNVWIGDKATILPNVTIGDGSVIGANSVVTKNIPPNSIWIGNPGRLIKRDYNES